jgi:hypothetical protein
MNSKLLKKGDTHPEASPSPTKREILLKEIRDLLKK